MKPARALYDSVVRTARTGPRAVAVIDSTTFLTYHELLQAVDARATSLLEVCRPGDRVGVLLEVSAATVITYFACLRAGVLYTPMLAYPDAVLSNLIRRLDLAVLVTDRSIDCDVPLLGDAATASDTAAFPAIDPAAPAHILLTSGTSSGMPKAVSTDQIGSLLSHAWRTGLCPFQTDDVVGCNIFGIWDVVPALQHGVPVVMLTDAVLRDPLALAGSIVRHGITRMMLTPSLLRACLASPLAVDALRRLRLIVLCGEVAQPTTLQRAQQELPGTRLLDLYSIAECHDVAAGFVHAGQSRLRPAPFADVRLVERDNRERPVGVGETGRILVGGPGVAAGYVGIESERFFEWHGRRWYDTGDLGVQHDNGELTVVGRADARTKVRGRWVDPVEVEAVLARHPDVVDVTVTVEDGRLVAKIFGGTADLPRRLRAHAARLLPSHAVPDRIEQADVLDIAPSGKAGNRGPTPTPRPLDSVVVSSFRDVLDDPTIGLDDHFTDVGGSSLDAIELCGRLQQATGRALSVADFYRAGRPRAVARMIEGTAASLAEDWRLPGAGAGALPPITRQVDAPTWRHPLITGTSGFLGGAVAVTLAGHCTELSRPAMDLDKPRLGLTPAAFDALAERIDGVIHVAARVDPFADFDALYRTNVGGTLELIRLAGVRGVPIHHVSSSAVFPLGTNTVWTPDDEPTAALAGPLRVSGADAYSHTKLAAEIALWQAAGRGLPVRIVRVPHILGHPQKDRLLKTLAVLCAAGVYPDGPWRWQFVSRDRVVDALVAPPATAAQICHVALPPVVVADVVRHLGLDLDPVPMAAIATALERVEPAHPRYRDARVLRQLVNEHGPVAALCMNDAILSHADGDALALLATTFQHFETDTSVC